MLAVAALLASGALTTGSLVPATLGSAAAQPGALHSASASSGDVAGTYLVVLQSAPAATYDGSTPGFTRTAPRHGERFDADRPAVQAYEDHLLDEQGALLDQLGSPSVLYHYTTALNGFAVSLTSEQVASLREHSDVLAVEPSRVEHLAGAPSSDALRLGGDRGLWKRVGGPTRAGHGIVIGFVDSGLWPENPSFAGVPLDDRTRNRVYPGFTGTCQTGERWSGGACSAKVIAARSFVSGFGPANLSAADYTSPRDGSGHGSHTAAIAAGNTGVDVTVGRQHFGHVSGVAPAAAIAIYKACWSAPDPDNDGCATPDTVKAVDQAVHDGVDVLNYSVSGHDDSTADVVELAFLNAAAAGVFVSAAAGDDGPAPGSVSHSAPWVTTVGASTTNGFQGSVVLGNGRHLVGSMAANQSVRNAPLLYARHVPARGVSPTRAARCFPGSLDAGRVEGAVVICDRGANGRVTKSQTVNQAGGIGMVLVNDAPGSTEADLHAVPTVHVTQPEGLAIKRYAARAAHPKVTLDAGLSEHVTPSVADFSSRGPSVTTHGDVLKPDLTAPGVSVLAAVAPASNFGHLWDIYSGSSMAAPQVSGLAAIIAARHPDWTPAMTKSALMTTAHPMASSATLSQGAGDVRAGGPLLDPGLVYDAGLADWLGYLRGSSQGAAFTVAGDDVDEINGADLNSASIAVGSLVGEETVTRTVTNVGSTTETYTARVQGVRGIAVSVSRPSLTLRPGQSATFDVTFSARRSAHYAHFAAGSLTWVGSNGHVVRSPIVVRPELVRAPAELTGKNRRGDLVYHPRAGVTGTIATASSGFVGARPTGFVLSTGRFNPAAPASSDSTLAQTFTVPARTTTARWEVRTASPGDDLDLYVYRDDRLVAQDSDEGGDALVSLDAPTPGRYTAYVHAAEATGDVTLGSLTGWVLRDRHAGRIGTQTTAPIRVNPSPVNVTGGQKFGMTVRWKGLDLAHRWLAAVTYDDSQRRTFITVN
jgi:hypothetical protein